MKIPPGYSQLNTTVPSDLLRNIKAQAAAEGVSLQALIVRGLRLVRITPAPVKEIEK